MIRAVNELIQGYAFILQFLFSDIYQFAVDAFAYLSVELFVLWIKIKIFTITFFADAAVAIIDQIDLSTFIEQYWSSISPNALYVLSYFKIPESLNIIFSAMVTSLLMRFWSVKL